MKKGKVSFRVIGDSGPLSISWFQGPKGNAVEAKNEIGVGFFSESGELLAVEFDDVEERKDHQVLEFDRYQVEVTVEQGSVRFGVKEVKLTKRKQKRTSRKRKAA
ncbi:hypothetical protein EBS43_09045 [bacterium]|jgi:hypothetical protein|nr:hypothetical protein [bacterium]